MKNLDLRLSTLLILGSIVLSVGGSAAVLAQQAPTPTVPQRMTLTGEFVRLAYNEEGYVVLGYRIANDSVGDEWLLLQAGITLMAGVKSQDFAREAFTLKTPDGTVIPLATAKQFVQANRLTALNRRADVVRDSVNYFPITARRACRLAFFSDPTRRDAPSLSFTQVSLDPTHACVGRIFFHLPDGIETGQYWLVANFSESSLEVPFRIMTKIEEKDFRKKWRELKKEHDADTGQ